MKTFDSNISLISEEIYQTETLKSVYMLEEFKCLQDWKKRYVDHLQNYYDLLIDSLPEKKK